MQKRATPTRLALRLTLLLALAAMVCPPAEAAKGRTRQSRKQQALAQFETAEKQREALSGKPTAQRTHRDYDKVIQAYWRVYRLSPASPKAHESLQAMAELKTDMGRILNDPTILEAAIEQYHFLRREYPGSRYRWNALLTVGFIYLEDLKDEAKARSAFEGFLKLYPQHLLAEKAQAALVEVDKRVAARQQREKELEQEKLTAKSARVAPSEPPKSPDEAALVTSIRHWTTPDYIRVAIDLGNEVKYEAGRITNPERIFFDLHGTKLAPELVGKAFDVESGLLRKIRVGQYQKGMTRVVLEVDEVSEYSAFILPNPYRLVIDVHGRQGTAKGSKETQAETKLAEVRAASSPAEPKKPDKTEPLETAKLTEKETKATPTPTTAPTYESVTPRGKESRGKETPAVVGHKAKPTTNGEHSLIRALGLKIGKIVIDAGHGGHDTGTIGPKGLMEKDLVLDVAMRLGKMLQDRLGAEVVYTREDDTFVPLESRTAIANQQRADLFLSIHANSSRDSGIRGVETYYLNFTSSSEALEVAARENAVSEKSIYELQDLVKKIAMMEKIEESRELASAVQNELHKTIAARTPGLKNRGVKKAPFVVLIGANMPSILAEVSFLSNPRDERQLRTNAYRQRIAESLFRGVAEYADGLSGIKVAVRSGPESGQ